MRMICSKIKYDKLGTQIELKRINTHLRKYRRKNIQRHEMRAYYCPQCNAWHLTSKEERTEEEIQLENQEDFYSKLKQVIEINE